jgi:hypothetical protein
LSDHYPPTGDRLDLHVHLPERLELHVNIHLHDEQAGGVTGMLEAIRTQLIFQTGLLETIQRQGAHLMTMNADTKAVLTRIETATTDLGVRVRAIQDKVGTGMSEADVAAVNTELGAIAGNLEGMAKDPENPIPPLT